MSVDDEFTVWDGIPDGMQWLVKSTTYSNIVFPVDNEQDARAMITKFRAGIRAHRMKTAFEYGVHDPAEPNSYWRVGP